MVKCALLASFWGLTAFYFALFQTCPRVELAEQSRIGGDVGAQSGARARRQGNARVRGVSRTSIGRFFAATVLLGLCRVRR